MRRKKLGTCPACRQGIYARELVTKIVTGSMGPDGSIVENKREPQVLHRECADQLLNERTPEDVLRDIRARVLPKPGAASANGTVIDLRKQPAPQCPSAHFKQKK